MSWPKPLQAAQGPIRTAKLDGAAEGMGEFGVQLRALADDGLLPPDILTAQTLFILSHQPRNPNKKQRIPGGGGGVAGGVWVRERYTIHQPITRDDAFVVQGESLGRHVHKGRRYGNNQSVTTNAAGELVATNLTTGLLAYKVETGLEDQLEGVSPDEVTSPQPDWTHAANNPSADRLRRLQVGDAITSPPTILALSLMEARDTKNPDNPIHSDPELAKKAGLDRPIAGGAHVLAYPIEVLLQRVGRMALLYGASFDVRWKAPVYADAEITPVVRVVEAASDRVVCDLQTLLSDDVQAMTATVTIPLP